ncbi:MAG: SH3 domain-containing protein [Paracoccaceae bacterium]
MRFPSLFLAILLAVSAPGASMAQVEQRAAGQVTGLPIPRFVSLKTSEGRARRGPSTSHRVDWIYTHRDMPLMVTAEFEHWRRVEDAEGQGGWVHYSLLSGVRTIIVQQDMAPLRSRPSETAPEVARLEAGVIARIIECDPGWCRLNIDGTRGWLNREALWGLFPGETLD